MGVLAPRVLIQILRRDIDKSAAASNVAQQQQQQLLHGCILTKQPHSLANGLILVILNRGTLLHVIFLQFLSKNTNSW